jgi:hypothetical protein
MHTARWLVALTLAGTVACQEQPPAQVVAPAAPAAPAPAAKAPAAPAPTANAPAAPAPTAPAPAAKAPAAPAGAVVAVGEKLTGLPAVTVAQLLKDPTAYAGKKVRIEGPIASYCFHKRDWYAVRDSDAPGPSVRILTGDAFLVPENAQGKRARTEGTVEVADVPAERARHYAGEHGLGDLTKVQGDKPFKQVTIRAAGAEFI